MLSGHNVDLDLYNKRPRLLHDDLERALLTGELQDVLNEVKRDPTLRLEIRNRCFNVYFQGGSLLRVSGAESSWEMHFDWRYLPETGGERPSDFQKECRSGEDCRAWVDQFDRLKKGMKAWWRSNPNKERCHCQEIATANGASVPVPATDFCVIDLEYQWARCRFDLVAAKRRRTASDPEGWSQPVLVFVEVKSDPRACSGKAGMARHAMDYRDIIWGPARQRERMKKEIEDVVRQKSRLGLISRNWPFGAFAREVEPELLIVFDDLDPGLIMKPLADVGEVLTSLSGGGSILALPLGRADYAMRENGILSWGRLLEMTNRARP